jgi:hypothetical protein
MGSPVHEQYRLAIGARIGRISYRRVLSSRRSDPSTQAQAAGIIINHDVPGSVFKSVTPDVSV